MVIQVRVFTPKGEEKNIDLCESEKHLKKMTVVQMTEIITEEIQEDIRIVFRTEFMEESNLVTTYGIKHMSTIHTVLRVNGGI